MAFFNNTMSSEEDYSFYDYNHDHDIAINSTDDYYGYVDSIQPLPMSYVYIPLLYFIMFIAGFSGNLFVILVIGNRRKRSGRLVDTFVLNLALADLIFVLTLPMWAVSASLHSEWPFGKIMCKISSFIIAVNRFSNIFFLTCMSVDRYLAVVRLMDSQFLRRSRCAQLTCVAVWIVSFLLGIPSLVYRKLTDDNLCSEDSTSSFVQGMNLLTIVLTFMLPVLILVVCYGSVLVTLRRHCHLTANSRAGARRRHSLKIVFTIILAFLISWLPFNVFKSVQMISLRSTGELREDTRVFLYRGLTLSCCLAFLNSCVNPAVYLFLDHHFRHRAYVLCQTCLGHAESHQNYISSNSFSNGTSETCSGNASTRGRLFSLTQKN